MLIRSQGDVENINTVSNMNANIKDAFALRFVKTKEKELFLGN